MKSGNLDAFASGAIDLGLAAIVQPDAGRLRVVAKANPTRYGLALLCLAVAAFTAWQTRIEVEAIGLPGLWPGVVIVPVFVTLMLGLSCYEQEKDFDAEARRAVTVGRLLGLAVRLEHPLPPQGRVRLGASIEFTRSEPGGVRPLYTYLVEIADNPALGFTLKGDRESATDFATRVARLLDYSLSEDLAHTEATGWHAARVLGHRR